MHSIYISTLGFPIGYAGMKGGLRCGLRAGRVWHVPYPAVNYTQIRQSAKRMLVQGNIKKNNSIFSILSGLSEANKESDECSKAT